MISKPIAINLGSIIVVLVFAIIYKALMILMRLLGLLLAWRSFMSASEHVRHRSHENHQRVEAILFLDLITTSAPLAIITIIGLVHEIDDVSELVSNPTKMWELIKLLAFAVDVLGTSWFFFQHSVGFYSASADHSHAHEKRASDERKRLLPDEDNGAIQQSESEQQ